MIKLKRKTRKLSQKNPEVQEFKTAYNSLKNQIAKRIKLESRQQWEAATAELNGLKDGRKFWQTFKRLTGNGNKNTANKPVLKANGEKTTGDQELADTFAESLGNIHNMHTGPIFDNGNKVHVDMIIDQNKDKLNVKFGTVPETGDDHSSVEDISLQELKAVFSKLKLKSAAGEDGLTYAVIKHCPNKTLNAIREIYNTCLRVGYYPTNWKAAIGKMLQKQGKDPSIVTNYRPISLLRVIGKIFEKILTNRLYDQMVELGHFNKWQRAYMRGKEASEHVYRLGSTAAKAVRRGWCTGAVLLDVEKAFDSVWHNGLKYKLLHLGIPTKMVRVLSSFINSRTIKVKVGETISKVVELKAGTPQGSVLSPLLFLLYVNDLPVNPRNKTSACQFADDTGLWATDRNCERVRMRLQQSLWDLEIWCSLWRIKINTNKTQFIMFTRQQRVVKPLILFGNILQKVKEVTLLGVTLTGVCHSWPIAKN